MQTLGNILFKVDMDCTRWKLTRKRTSGSVCVARQFLRETLHCSGPQLLSSPAPDDAARSQWGCAHASLLLVHT